MSVHVFKRDQLLRGVSLEEAWGFFSRPENLKLITPDYMGFDIVSKGKLDEMYPGQIIRYIVKPLAGLPMQWTTEITHVQEPFFFIDDQRQGPYKIWHHQHKFTAVEAGTMMEDIVHYRLPLGVVGDLVNRWVVRKKLKEIFDHRKKVVKEIFSSNG